MMEQWAWRDFNGFLETLRVQAINDFIAFDERQAVEFKVGQYKGILECLDRIKKELDFIVSS